MWWNWFKSSEKVYGKTISYYLLINYRNFCLKPPLILNNMNINEDNTLHKDY